MPVTSKKLEKYGAQVPDNFLDNRITTNNLSNSVFICVSYTFLWKPQAV